jgi:YesN/AraC family two-component response regulator
MTLAAILSKEGFDVTTVGSVPEALQTIQTDQFDILLSDLNIGQPGDGFTVVSAMRRVQPRALTYILTGYPDFENALAAIRNQVDDFFTKPVDVVRLIQTFRESSPAPQQLRRPVSAKKISMIIRENRDRVVESWVARCSSNEELSRVRLSRNELIEHIPELLLEIADRIDIHPEEASTPAVEVAAKHGISRCRQGYSLPMLLVESAILEKTLSELMQENLLSIEISTLIPDLHQMSDAINCAVETAVRTFLQQVSGER